MIRVPGLGPVLRASRQLLRGAARARQDPAALWRRSDRFGLRDVLSEATAGVGSRPGRLALTVLGTVLGIASVVVTVGLAQTAANRINDRFDAVAATHASAAAATRTNNNGENVPIGSLPWDSPSRAMRLNGVEAAASVSEIALPPGTEISAVSVHDPTQSRSMSPTVVAVSPELPDAVGATISQGRFFDSGHDVRGDRVAVLGADAARRLGISRVATLPSIFIGDEAYQVIGIISDTNRRSDLLTDVLIPEGAGRADFALASPKELELRIAIGGGPLIAEQLPVALAPTAPDSVTVTAPAAPGGVQSDVQGDVNVIFLALGGVALLIGGVGIANVTLLSVMERAGEIGLRRALGARRRDIAGQFVVESVIVGGLGGLIGASTGVAVVAVVSLLQHWTPILDLSVVGTASVGGAVVGLLAGLYPAWRAARLEPVAALRSGL
jgi:putative ABC transport system permease protein